MNIDDTIRLRIQQDGLSRTLGMQFFSTPEPDTCKGTMPVDDRTVQPFGVLSGGATLALAEILAGIGSSALCPGKMCVGINVSGNHERPAFRGDTVTATARIEFQGGHIHHWHIEVRNQHGTLISTAHVSNYVTDMPRKQ